MGVFDCMENRLQWKKAHICEKIALRNWQAAQFDKIANTQIAFTRERRQLVCDVSRQKKIEKLMTAVDNFPFFFVSTWFETLPVN